MAVVKRIPLILLFLFLFFGAWVSSPLWAKSLPVSTQKTFAASTNLATKVYAWMSGKGQNQIVAPGFKPGHYTGIPKGADFIANFSVAMNVDKNMIAHPKLKLNGNVITPPLNDSKAQFLIAYPGQKLAHPALVSETTWIAYFKAHSKMFVQVSPTDATMDVWVMADKQWWTKQYAGKVTMSNPSQGSSSSSNSIGVGSQLSGDQGFSVPGY